MGSIGNTYILDGGVKVNIRPRNPQTMTDREYRAKTRVFVWNMEEKDEELNRAEKALPAPKEKGKDKENDRAYNAYNRLYGKKTMAYAKKYVLDLVSQGILSFIFANSEDAEFKFSRKAGCSCPCSPGVVIDSMMREGDSYVKFDIYITL